MLVNIGEATVTSVWAERFKGRDGDDVEFYRALLSVPGEAPMQLGVTGDEYGEMSGLMGRTGEALVEIDARPGNRARVYFKGLE